MAKVTDPYDDFKTSRRAGKDILLKNRREGFTVTLQALTRKMVFFKENHDDLITTEIKRRWDLLSPGQKAEWETLGNGVYMDGKTYYKQQEKKSMTQGFYGVAVYGATRNLGVIKTKYSTIYGEAIYGVSKYRKT